MSEKPTVATALKRIKIDFDSVDMANDLKIRAFLGTLKTDQLPILEEILHSSARTSIDELLEELDAKKSDIEPTLEAFEKIGLLKVQGEEITVVKEMRRLVDVHFERTEEDFEPDVDFALSVMRTLPVQQVPLWYALPKTSTNLRTAIIEKFFMTPALYERHLETTQFEDEVLQKAFDRVRREMAPMSAKDLQEELGIDDAAFHKIVLILELNFITYLKYTREKGELVPELMPIREYSAYAKRVAHGALFPQPHDELAPKRPGPFAFLRDLNSFVVLASKMHLSEDLSLDSIKKIARELNMPADSAYISTLKERALSLRLLENADGELVVGANLEKWERLAEEDRPFCYLRHPSLAYDADEKSVRAAEKSISLIFGKGWIAFDDFIRAALIPLRPEIEVSLTGRGQGCHYAFPVYTEEERALVHHVIFQSLAESGFVETADDYFRLSAFGELVFGPQE